MMNPGKYIASPATLLISVFVCGLLSAASVWTLRFSRDIPAERHIVLSADARVRQSRCAECHSDICDHFSASPHARTLSHVSDKTVGEGFAGRSVQHESSGAMFQYREEQDRIAVSTSRYAREVYFEWVFGSGTHARTPLITWTDADGKTSGIEHSISWYPGGRLGETVGTEEIHDAAGVYVLGHPRPATEVVNCFGCHSSFLPKNDDRLDLAWIEPGVGCVRCHTDAAKHLDDLDNGRPSRIERFSELSPRESVDRCGECHRRADEMSGEIRADDKSLVRFASVGLVQSKCFQLQHEVQLSEDVSARLDCTSCHNPHHISDRSSSFQTSVCRQCHSGEQNTVVCSAPDSGDNCGKCHMPKVPANKYLEFTDHWIRIHDQPSADLGKPR